MNIPFLDLKRQYQTIREEVEPAVQSVMENCSFIGGKFVKNFEKQIAGYLGVHHALGCGNGTEALVLALRACGIKPGDEVITTSFTFFATSESIASIGAVPVFVDINENDYNIDPDKIEEKITQKTRAILPVHIFGAPCDMDRIMAIADKYNLRVIEDAAQAIGSQYKGRMAGGLGHIGCFSFYPTKNLGGFGDGGMVTTNDDDLAIILSALREHGAAQNGARAFDILNGNLPISSLNSKENTSELYNPYKYFNYLIGYNSRLDAIQAAVLSIKLHYLDGYNKSRSVIADTYNEGLCNKVIRPEYSADIIPCWHQYVIRTPYKHELCNYLQENKIGSGTFYPIPLHLQKAFEDLGYKKGSLPITERIAAETVCLPIFPELTSDETAYIIETVNNFFLKCV